MKRKKEQLNTSGTLTRTKHTEPSSFQNTTNYKYAIIRLDEFLKPIALLYYLQ